MSQEMSRQISRQTSVSRELLIAALAIVTSALLLPGLIYVVGSKLFGSYGQAGGMSSMYLATLQDLSVPRLAAWTLVLAPALCLCLLRLVIHATASGPDNDQPKQRSAAANKNRREPTLNG